MSSTVETDTPSTDGRRLRRERSRNAIIDAVFALIRDGKVPPTVDDVAERAGVSVSSVFRNFDGLDDLQRQAFDRFQERFEHLFAAPTNRDADVATRLREHVRTRIELYMAAGPLMHVARQRSLDYQPMAEGVAHMRERLSAQTRQRFAAEIQDLTPADAANLIAFIDASTSPEAYDLTGAAHARSARQIARTWVRGLEIVLAGWTSASAANQAGDSEPERGAES
jgi:TetR/AcrR family transcriptional regulator of autoinduction and epiphytic fitness